LAATPALASVELRIEHSVVRALLAQQAFTEDGRMYVRGKKDAGCSFAYLENPEVGSEEGRLRIRARFTGRSATDVFGRCVGLGDSFFTVITAVPYYQEGAIRLRDVVVRNEGQEGFYARRVRTTLARELPAKFSFRVYEDARRALEAPLNGSQALYRQQLERFDVSDIRVTDEAVVVVIDFALVVTGK
jgi:hypothetical protein